MMQRMIGEWKEYQCVTNCKKVSTWFECVLGRCWMVSEDMVEHTNCQKKKKNTAHDDRIPEFWIWSKKVQSRVGSYIWIVGSKENGVRLYIKDVKKKIKENILIDTFLGGSNCLLLLWFMVTKHHIKECFISILCVWIFEYLLVQKSILTFTQSCILFVTKSTWLQWGTFFWYPKLRCKLG